MKQLRFGEYCVYKGQIFRFRLINDDHQCHLIINGKCTENLKQLGFRKYADLVYTLDVNRSDIQTAFYVNIYGSYKTYECEVADIKNNIVYLHPSSEYLDYLVEIGKYSMNYYYRPEDPEYQLKVNESEVLNIWEKREPIKGFKFDVEPIFYLKKDGIWLENYEEE